MKEDDCKHIESEIVDAILEKPIVFAIDGKLFYMYPPSFGISLLTTTLLSTIEDCSISSDGVLQLCTNNRDVIVRLIAYHTFKFRKDVLCEHKVLKRIKQIEGIEITDIATLYVWIIKWNTSLKSFIKYYHLDQESRIREKIQSVKKDSSNITLGGKSLYGSLLGNACEKFGWKYDYVVWGLSIINLNMLLSDCIQSIYLTDKERQKAKISTDGKMMRGDDINNLQEIRRLLKGK